VHLLNRTHCSFVSLLSARRNVLRSFPLVSAAAVLIFSSLALSATASLADVPLHANERISYTGPGVVEPLGIRLGPDGAMSFTNFGNGTIGTIAKESEVSISPSSGPPGIEASLKRSNFSAGGKVTLKYDAELSDPDPHAVTLCTATVKSSGAFECVGHIPRQRAAGPTGAHVVTVTERSSPDAAKTLFREL
jgi:hypothetical protein